jgi:methanogenic corrinoid protein MtbC1
MSEKEILQELYDGVLKGDREKTVAAAKQSLDASIAPLEAIEEGMTPAIKEVGDRFGRMEMFLPEMVASAEAMEAGLEILEPHFEGDEGEKKGKVLIGTVQGDIHDIGKNIVIALLKVNGYEVIDIGRDMASTEFVDKAINLGVDIIGLSGLLTTSQEYADEIGADGYGETAFSAVELCSQLIAESN